MACIAPCVASNSDADLAACDSPCGSSSSGEFASSPRTPRLLRAVPAMISTVACVNVQTASDVSDEDDKSENAEEGGSMGQALGIAGEVEVADAPTSPPLAGVGDVAAPAAPRVSDALTGMLVVAVPAGPLLVPFAWREFGVHATATAEPLLYDASCALRDGMLLSQGRLFVFKRRVAFYSCIFGFVRRKILVTHVRPRNLAKAGVFGALEVCCGEEQVVFASLWDRDAALAAITLPWRAFQESEPAHADTLASDAQPAAPAATTAEPAQPAPAPRQMRLQAATLPPVGYTQLQLGGAAGDALTLTCNAEELWTLCFADGSRFTEAFRSARGECDIVVPPWSQDGEAYTRQVTFRAPLEAMRAIRLPGIPTSTRIREDQRCVLHRLHDGSTAIVLEASSAQLDIPYGDSFVLDTRLELRSAAVEAAAAAEAAAGTHAIAHCRVRWLRPPKLSFVKTKIESQSRDSSCTSFRQLLSMAERYLSQASLARAGVANPAQPPRDGDQVTDEQAAAAPPLAMEGGDETATQTQVTLCHARPLHHRSSVVRFGPVAFGAVCDALQATRMTVGTLREAPVRPLRDKQTRWCTLRARFARFLLALLLCAAVFAVGWHSGSRAELQSLQQCEVEL